MAMVNQPPQLSEKKRIRKLVFRGGGTKGLLLLGTVEELEKHQALADVREVWGSSAGGIISMMLGLGMTATEIRQQILELDFEDFMDKDTPFWSEALGVKSLDFIGFSNITDKIESLFRTLFSKGHGVFIGDAFSDYVKHLIASRTGYPNLTFKELHDAATNPKSPIYDPRLKDIMLTGSKIYPHPPELKVFNWHDTPNMPIWKAVRISMSFPGAFKAVEHNNEFFVDGGLKDNLPVQPAIDFDESIDSRHVRTTNNKDGIIGVSMESTSVIESVNEKSQQQQSLDDLSAVDFAMQVGKAATANVELLKTHKDRIVMPDSLDEPTLNFSMTDEKKKELLEEGRRAAQEFFASRPDFSADAHNKANYQQYQQAKDIEHLIEEWQLRTTLLKNVGDGDEPLGKLTAQIAEIEKKYRDFDITFNGSRDNYRQRLETIFAEKEQWRQKAIVEAQQRMRVNEETARIFHAFDNLHTVGEIINEYQTRKKQFDLLLEDANNVLKINEIMAEIIENKSTENIQEACEILDSKIRALYILRKLPAKTIENKLQDLQDEFSATLQEIGIAEPQRSNFVAVLQVYAQSIMQDNQEIISPGHEGQNLQQYYNTLTSLSQRLQEDVAIFKSSLKKLERTCCCNGLQILFPEQHEEFTAEHNENLTIKRLHEAHAELERSYNTSIHENKFNDIGRALSPAHYIQVIKAKQATFKDINNSTNYAVKIADFLQRNCTFLYRGYHFLACLNPFSTYTGVILMRKVHMQLDSLQVKLEQKPNIYTHTEVSQNYITAIETINERLHDNGSDADNKGKEDRHKKKAPRDKTYQELNKLLTNFEKHIAKQEQILVDDNDLQMPKPREKR